MKPFDSSRDSRSGFTLIELMIVIAILGIMAVPLVTMLQSATKFSEDHLQFTRAAALLARQAELVKTAPYAQLQVQTGQNLDSSLASALTQLPEAKGKLEIAPQPGQPGIKRVFIEVNWVNPWGAPKSLHSVILRSAP